jgi:hypothetical protein
LRDKKRIHACDLPLVGFEFVPRGVQLARKGVGTVALGREFAFLFRQLGTIGVCYLQCFGMRGSKTR